MEWNGLYKPPKFISKEEFCKSHDKMKETKIMRGGFFLKKFVLLMIMIIVLTSMGYSQPVNPESTTPVPSADVDAKRVKILNFITDLSTNNVTSFKGAISGQNCYHGSQITDSDYLQGYKNMVETLHTVTGKWVGIIGVDYEWQQIFTPAQLSQTNKVLINYAKAGGIITINLSPQNPWGNDETDIANNPGSWDSKVSGTQTGIPAKASLNDLNDSAKPVHIAWMRKLDRIAAALQELRDAGVIALFRPMQEPNGSWFWWGMKSHPNDPSPYVNVYRDMHDYFTNTKKLNNLLWVYSPNASMGETNSSSWNRTVDWAYPGADYVDIIAGTTYNDSITLADYRTYIKMNKPLGIAELGPKLGGTDTTRAELNGTWDTHSIITTIKKKYPKVAYWVCWHSYPKECWSIISNKNPGALMNDPYVINRDNLPSW
jgi:mannan endo-1,4-beta-mannosidase